LTNEPLYEGEPILAVAAVDEYTAAEAIEKIQIEFEPLPFVVDPLVSLRPGGPNPRLEGNIWGRPEAPPAPAGGRGAPPAPLEVQELKWTEADFAGYSEGHLPMGKTPPDGWTYGDLEAGFKNAALVLDESFVTPNTHHQTLEPRTAMAYCRTASSTWYTGTQSAVQTVGSISRWLRARAGGRRAHQRVHRRRLREQGHGRRHVHDPGAAVEEGRRAGDDAHHPGGGALHRRCPSEPARAA